MWARGASTAIAGTAASSSKIRPCQCAVAARPGSAQPRSSCQLTDANNYVAINNVIRNNRASGGYGILLIGNDEVAPYLAPRQNTITGNDVFGSVHGCADDFRPGQWSSDRNAWSGCPVAYF